MRRLLPLLLFLSVPAYADITVEDSAANQSSGSSYTPAAGSDRVVIYSSSAIEDVNTLTYSSITYDGTAMSIDVQRDRTTAAEDYSVAIAAALEANLPAGAGTFTVTFSNTPDDENAGVLTLAGVDQSGTRVVGTDTSSPSTNTDLTFSVPVVAGGIVIAQAAFGTSADLPAGYTSFSQGTGTVDSRSIYKLITADGTENLTWTGSGAHRVGAIVSLRPASTAGVYDTAPTVTSQTTTAYTVTGSLDAAGDVDAVLCHKDQTDPTIAQVQAGTCTGGVAARATAAQSPATTPFDFSLVLTPSTALPVGDVYVTDGTTLTTLADEYLDAPATCGENSDLQCQFIDITSIGTGSPCEDFNTAQNPDIASPDVLTAPTTVEPGGGVDESLTIGADCQFTYDADNTGQQKAFNVKIHDISAEGFHAEDIDALFNNSAPTCGTVEDQVLDQDAAITTFDLDSACADADSEQLTYSLTYSATHTGANNAATLTDSAGDFVVDNLIGLTIDNDTDGSSCTITDNDATTVTCTLAGGTDNDWDTSDAYTITYVLPTGLSLNTSNGEVTGTPTVEDESGTTVRFTATDIGEETDFVSWKTWVVDTWTLPDLTTGDQDAATTAVLNAAPWREEEVLTANVACDNVSDPAEASGQVISQDPAASSELEPFASVAIRVSTGAVCGGGKNVLGVKGLRIGM